jgi:lipopolysaccharide export system protein LptA
MPHLMSPLPPFACCPFSALVCAVALACVVAPAHAEKADRTKPIVIEADRDLVADNQRQTVIYNGNAVLSQGTMILRAERIEVRELPDGYRVATAIGSRAKPATWRQRRDGVDEIVEGSADRIDFDGKADSVRFAGNAGLRRLRNATVADEVNGNVILWDNVTEVFKVQGGVTSTTNPTGRVRAVLSPRAETTTAPAPAAASAPPGTLAPVRNLGERR